MKLLLRNTPILIHLNFVILHGYLFMCLCVLIFKTDCVSLFLSILPIVQFSDGRGYEIEPFLFFYQQQNVFSFLGIPILYL
jgi:hypothetical protein